MCWDIVSKYEVHMGTLQIILFPEIEALMLAAEKQHLKIQL